MRYLLTFLMIFGVLLAAEKPQLARLHYSGGGDWYNDPDIIPNLVEFLNKTLLTDFSIEQATVKPDASEIFDYPFIFMTGHGNVKFSDKELTNLRDYCNRGGFLYIDDDYGMDKSIRLEIGKLFPNSQLVELPANHAIFNCYYNLKDGLPKTHKHEDNRPQAFGIFDDYGRLMLLYTYESNISDGWSNAHDDPQKVQDAAFKMGANIFYYLLTK